MIAGIVGVPERQKYIDELSALISPSVDRLEVFMDADYRGHTWNLSRTIETLTASARDGEPVLILADDAVTVPDWRERWQKIHASANNSIYAMFGRQRHLFSPANISRGYVTKCQSGGFYDLACIFIEQRNLMAQVKKWFDAGGCNLPSVARRQKHLDVLIQEFFIDNRTPWTITTPSLFDHRIGRSTLGHKIGGSPCYIGAR